MFAHTPIINNFSIRATLRFPEVASGIFPFITAIYAAPDSSAFDWGGLGPNGLANVGWFTQNSPNAISPYLTPDEVSTQDINYRLDAMDDSFRAKFWVDGGEDEAEWISWTRSVSQSDDFGIAVNPQGLVPENVVVHIRDYAVLPYLTGDFNASDVLDAEDIDLLSTALRDDTGNRVFDLEGDTLVTEMDHRQLVTELVNTWYGDSNLDGKFNSLDFVVVFQAAQYDDVITGNSTWATGDWNGDAEFDSADFVLAFQDGGYEKGPKNPIAVPEPSAMWAWIMFLPALKKRVM